MFYYLIFNVSRPLFNDHYILYGISLVRNDLNPERIPFVIINMRIRGVFLKFPVDIYVDIPMRTPNGFLHTVSFFAYSGRRDLQLVDLRTIILIRSEDQGSFAGFLDTDRYLHSKSF